MIDGVLVSVVKNGSGTLKTCRDSVINVKTPLLVIEVGVKMIDEELVLKTCRDSVNAKILLLVIEVGVHVIDEESVSLKTCRYFVKLHLLVIEVDRWSCNFCRQWRDLAS